MSPTVASNPGRRARHNLCHLGFRSCFFVLCLFLALPTPSSQASALGKRDLVHLSSSALSSITAHPDPVKNIDPTNPSSHLSKILIPRVPDTENNTAVRQYIVSTLTQLNWHIEEDSFTDSTPYGEKRFTNVIATKDPRAPRRVIVAAHFDSKFFSTFPQNQFVGATDSAAPCAFMLDLAEALNPMLDKRLRRISRRDDDEDDDDDDGDEDEDDDLMDTTLQFVFFDGEEAFKDWTATDSIYGARNGQPPTSNPTPNAAYFP
ncbi:hypothetical protein EW026_g1804 [Hermanssonia centrifuga]|uniref:Peptide hydrolase n=1 Tax=Hermanssonia centrifuga TaxID=98765 RepID=A0A4S4KUT0_9APHY|nr:hypothetical protein EW026_g1804 [Hermanssonia centrifuga]